MIINTMGVDCAAEDCDTILAVAAVAQEYCAGDVVRSEINSFILQDPKVGVPISNWGASLAATDINIDNTDASAIALKRFFGFGSNEEPEPMKVKTNNSQMQKIYETQTVTLEVRDVPPQTRDFFRQIGCGKIKPLLYYTTLGGKIYGRDGGIVPIEFDAHEMLAEGDDAVRAWKLTVKFQALTAPDEYNFPL